MKSFTIQEKNDHTGIAVVKFHADWCGPCKMFKSTFDKLSESVEGKDFYQCNIDEENELAASFNIRSVPTVLVVKDGKELARFTGNHEFDKLKTELDRIN